VARGLHGVLVVISDAHEELRSALARFSPALAGSAALPAQRGGRLLPPGRSCGASTGEDGVRPASRRRAR
jgi:hypothetical protein